MTRPRTWLIDIDGCIFVHRDDGPVSQWYGQQALLPGVAQKLARLEAQGDRIILVTGRPESIRALTVAQLQHFGVIYHQLVMDATGGERILVNDAKPSGSACRAIELERNIGIGAIC